MLSCVERTENSELSALLDPCSLKQSFEVCFELLSSIYSFFNTVPPFAPVGE